MFLLSLVLSVSLVGGVHPCDVAQPTIYREPSSQLLNLKVGFCFAPVDTSGNPITEAIGFVLNVNGGPDVDLGTLEPVPVGQNVNGDSFYQFQNPALAAGTITLKAYTVSLGMSASSLPITLTLLGPPKPPKNLSIGK